MKPTKDEVKKVLEATRKVRENLPEINFFGDDNWKALDEQIEILENEIKDTNSLSSVDISISRAEDECVCWIEEGDAGSDFGRHMIEDAKDYE